MVKINIKSRFDENLWKKKISILVKIFEIFILVKICQNLVLGKNFRKFRFWSQFSNNLAYGQNF